MTSPTPLHLHQDIHRWLTAYQAAFEHLDATAVAAFWQAPTLALDSQDARVCVDAEALTTAFTAAIDQLRLAGLRTAHWQLDQVRALGEGLADCVVRWWLRDAAGQLIKTLHNVYVLRRTEHDWKVAAVYLLEPGQSILSMTPIGDGIPSP
ncbi:DUF6841 family protein [Rivihabitans pingtungensis]|uniref:DUF6841 domain-containing protein n=1 Tax=Rivihabitans pingtungensis TaxID=1054498 RepID=A0A318L135_9NEIS|nr:hypothetical protein [Rivihabitans pingtungensis]PXX79243.1 hypothetical protein DFR34_108139 [Rivihabitans pingtungensis]